VTGRLLPPGAIEAFVDALQQLIEQPETRAAMGAEGLREAAKYSWDEVNNAVAETYLRVIRQRASGVAKPEPSLAY
jgi:phosphatidylinositol alpha 1,6-mannosyltransferase